jgi:hypothetical protein
MRVCMQCEILYEPVIVRAETTNSCCSLHWCTATPYVHARGSKPAAEMRRCATCTACIRHQTALPSPAPRSCRERRRASECVGRVAERAANLLPQHVPVTRGAVHAHHKQRSSNREVPSEKQRAADQVPKRAVPAHVREGSTLKRDTMAIRRSTLEEQRNQQQWMSSTHMGCRT